MKITQVSNHVWSLQTWVGLRVTVFVVKENDGLTLIDAGISMMAKGILKFMAGLNAGPLRRIALTHGHSDHVGAIPRILEAYPQAIVMAHGIEIPYMEGDMPYPGRKKAAASVTKGLARRIGEPSGGEGDTVKGDEPLASIGSLQPYHTPGHSPGHVAYYHEQDRVLIVGDLFTSKKGQLRKPMAMFTADMDEAVRSSAIVTRLRPDRLEVCHGTSVLRPADQMEGYLSAARAKG